MKINLNQKLKDIDRCAIYVHSHRLMREMVGNLWIDLILEALKLLKEKYQTLQNQNSGGPKTYSKDELNRIVTKARRH